jgi:hypothetical protein
MQFTAVKKFIRQRIVFILLLAGLGVRLGYMCTLEERWYFNDTLYYHTAALHLLKGEGFGPSSYFPNYYSKYCLEPLYPLFLAFSYLILGTHFWAARLIQVLLGMAQIFLLYLLAKRIFSVKTGTAFMLYGIFYPFAIYITGFLYITQLLSLLITLNIFALYKYSVNSRAGWLVVAAIALGLAIQSCPVYLLSVPFFCLWLFYFARHALKKKLVIVSVFLGVILTVLLPWSIRNYVDFKKYTFARACFFQDRVFGASYYNIQKKRMYTDHSFRIEKFSIVQTVQNNQVAFDFAVNDEPVFKFVPTVKMELPQNESYVGLLFCGPNSNQLSRFRVLRQSGTQPDSPPEVTWDSQVFIPPCQAVEQIHASSQQIEFAGGSSGWKYPVVFQKIMNGNIFEIYYPGGISPDQIRRVGILLDLDRPDVSANGLLAWLHPWREPDIWFVKDGVPFKSVTVQKMPYDQKKYSIFNLLRKYPKDFIFEHYLPMIKTFWSPWITGVRDKELQPGPFLQYVSFLSFFPVLLFMPFGIWANRHKLIGLSLLVIPMLSLCFGYSLFGTQTRYRLPIDILAILLAVEGFFHFYGFMTRRLIKNR